MGSLLDGWRSCCEAFEDRAADEFGNLRDYGVSEGVKLILTQPAGNPIMPSTHEGHDGPLNRCDKCVCFPKRKRRWIDGLDKLPRSRLSLASGVGNNPSPISSVRRTNGGSCDAMPFRIVPERGQRSENNAKPSIKQLWAVLHDDVTGSNFANEAFVLEPQSASRAGEPKAGAACRNILAGESPADNVWGNSIGSKLCRGKLSDVSVAGDGRPVLMKDTAGELLYFTECNGFETASALKSERKAANAAEQVQHLELAPILPGAHREYP